MRSTEDWEDCIIPSSDITDILRDSHQRWLNTPGKKGQARNESSARAVAIPPSKKPYTVQTNEGYAGRSELIEKACGG